jgi:hypothetical protein
MEVRNQESEWRGARPGFAGAAQYKISSRIRRRYPRGNPEQPEGHIQSRDLI